LTELKIKAQAGQRDEDGISRQLKGFETSLDKTVGVEPIKALCSLITHLGNKLREIKETNEKNSLEIQKLEKRLVVACNEGY
jgi:hypothetical protein